MSSTRVKKKESIWDTTVRDQRLSTIHIWKGNGKQLESTWKETRLVVKFKYEDHELERARKIWVNKGQRLANFGRYTSGKKLERTVTLDSCKLRTVHIQKETGKYLE